MLLCATPYGTTLRLAETESEEKLYFTPNDLDKAAAYYAEHGYVVLRALIPASLCDNVHMAFDQEVRRTRTPILRQKNMQYEQNIFDADGFLINAIYNVQDLRTARFGRFKHACLDILTHEGVRAATAALLKTSGTRLIQSMFFEAPAGTWAHQDSYYQDSAAGLGGCVAGWFALEDIDAGAGRFFVCPGSHRSLQVIRNEGRLNVADGHESYKQAVSEAIRANDLPICAPYLAKGDVLFWSSLTIHGSLTASRRHVSRASLTAHYLGESDNVLQFHSWIRTLKTTSHNGMAIGMLHDQDQWKHRLVGQVRFWLPGAYKVARRLALRTVIEGRRMQRRRRRNKLSSDSGPRPVRANRQPSHE